MGQKRDEALKAVSSAQLQLIGSSTLITEADWESVRAVAETIQQAAENRYDHPAHSKLLAMQFIAAGVESPRQARFLEAVKDALLMLEQIARRSDDVNSRVLAGGVAVDLRRVCPASLLDPKDSPEKTETV